MCTGYFKLNFGKWQTKYTPCLPAHGGPVNSGTFERVPRKRADISSQIAIVAATIC